MDSVAREVFDLLLRLGMARQPEQRRAAQDRESGRDQQCVELARIAGEASCCRLQPRIVGQRSRADRERRAGHRPRPQLLAQACGERRRLRWRSPAAGRRGHRSCRRSAGRWRCPAARRQGSPRCGIRSMKASSTISSRAATARSACGGNSRPVGLSGLTTTTTSASPLRDSATTADVVTVPAPVELVLGIGRPDDGDPRARHQPRQDLDQRLRAGRGDELAGLAAITLRRRRRSASVRRRATAGVTRHRPAGRRRDRAGD